MLTVKGHKLCDMQCWVKLCTKQVMLRTKFRVRIYSKCLPNEIVKCNVTSAKTCTISNKKGKSNGKFVIA